MVCIQETHAPDFASLPGDQPFVYDGPSNTGGCEAGFLFHESIRASTVPGVTDTQRTPWRLVSGLVCVCSFYAPHVGMDDQFRSLFWQELVASVKHTQRTLPGTRVVLSGDANVCWPEFHLGRERPRGRGLRGVGCLSETPCACHARHWSCARHGVHFGGVCD